ncbi:MAG: hypothetical protein NVS4B3_17960 [Gemmatimonadaceae bacterium]
MVDKPRDKHAHDSVTRDEPGDPKAVGKSTTGRGETASTHTNEAGRKDLGTKGKSGRPVGTSTARDSTGVDPQDPIDSKSPNLRRGGG